MYHYVSISISRSIYRSISCTFLHSRYQTLIFRKIPNFGWFSSPFGQALEATRSFLHSEAAPERDWNLLDRKCT